jgi:hypothetical protein
MKEKALPILFADDTSLVISNTDTTNLFHELEATLNKAQNWFKSNIMLLNYDKTSFIQFSLNSGSKSSLTAISNSCSINVTSSIKFLGIILESTLNWKQHIDYINSKLQSLGYIIRSLRNVLSLKVIKQIYNSYVHSLINYGIIFWGSSSHCKTLFTMQKRIIRIIMKAKARESCRNMFKELGILTLYSQYIYSILMFVVSHREIFTFNNEVHGLNTRRKLDLHVPTVSLTKVQKGVYYLGITIYNKLPNSIKERANNYNEFKIILKRFLKNNPYYSIEEFMDSDTINDLHSFQ